MQSMAAHATGNVTQEHMLMEASIQGINDAYIVIVGISIVGLLLSLFIKKVGQASKVQHKTKSVKKLINRSLFAYLIHLHALDHFL